MTNNKPITEAQKKIVEPEFNKMQEFIKETDKKLSDCPRCRRELGKYPALSRSDNKTEVCSDCGTWEAMYQFSNKGKLPSIENGFGVCNACGGALDSAGMCTAPLSIAD